MTRKLGCVRKDLTGQKFGKLTAVKRIFIGSGRPAKWECICECGNKSRPTGADLLSGHTSSCGCYSKEVLLASNIIHNQAKLNNQSNEYICWCNMKDRCYNLNSPQFKYYGARGIMICERWLNSFEKFYEDMGRRPSEKHSIERVNNDGNYELSNCVWATKQEQARNNRRNVWLEYDGVKMIQADWAKKWGVSPSTIFVRIKSGKSFDEIFKEFEAA